MSGMTLENIAWGVVAVLSLGIFLYLSFRAPSGRSRPDGSSYFAVAALIFVSQAALFFVLSINSTEDVTKPVLVLLWCAGMCIGASVWLGRGNDDGGGGGWNDHHKPEPVPPGDLGIPWESFDAWRENLDRQPQLR